MRWISFLAAALAIAPFASAQDVNPLQGYGPYRFGMTMEEARAADPSLLGPEGLASGRNTLLSPGRPRFGVIAVGPVLSFRDGRLNRAVFEDGNAVRTPEQCERMFDVVLRSLEETHGAFAGASGPSEYGMPMPPRTTAGGSSVRTYHYDQQYVSHANWRAGGWIEATAHFRPLGALADVRLCLITVDIRPQAQPLAPPLTPPTPQELSVARALPDPLWREQPDSDTFERTMPPYVPSTRVQVDVELDCLVIEGGRLNCVVAEERPPGQLYGEFALRLARAYRTAAAVGGESTLGRRVRVPVSVTLTGPGEAPPREGASAPEAASPPVDQAALRALAARAPSRADLDAAPLIERAQWIERPDAQAFARYYPLDALRRGAGGRLVLECLIAADGQLRCAVAEEEPADAGFGLAGLGIAQDFRMAPEVDGRPTVGKRVRVPIRFSVQ